MKSVHISLCELSTPRKISTQKLQKVWWDIKRASMPLTSIMNNSFHSLHKTA